MEHASRGDASAGGGVSATTPDNIPASDTPASTTPVDTTRTCHCGREFSHAPAHNGHQAHCTSKASRTTQHRATTTATTAPTFGSIVSGQKVFSSTGRIVKRPNHYDAEKEVRPFGSIYSAFSPIFLCVFFLWGLFHVLGVFFLQMP